MQLFVCCPCEAVLVCCPCVHSRYLYKTFFFIFFSFMFVIQYIVPLTTVISFIYSVAILCQSIVHEKEKRLKEVMKMMGLSNAVHWMAWFITSAVTMTAIVISLTIILKVIFIICFKERFFQYGVWCLFIEEVYHIFNHFHRICNACLMEGRQCLGWD